MGRHCLHRHLHDKPHLRGGAHVTPFGGVLASASALAPPLSLPPGLLVAPAPLSPGCT